MEELLVFTEEESKEVVRLLSIIRTELADSLQDDDEAKIRLHINKCMEEGLTRRDVFGLNPIVLGLQTALLAIQEIGLGRDAAVAIMLYTSATDGYSTLDDMERNFGSQVVHIIRGLQKVRELYKKTPTVESENFRNLLISFAEDMRVILIMIADRVNIMRQIRDTENIEAQRRVAEEASYLYAPLAHKLGLYR
ncbi:MAG: HD domain-containing protein, partial [Prevotellaceae bacterium]|nr:HD domain-containing protein [Prevotellaceae bacterium]